MPDATRAHHPAQRQDRQPGRSSAMRPSPHAEMEDYQGAGKLAGRVVLITGGAPSSIFPASSEAAWMTGQVPHPNGDEIGSG